MSSLDIDVKETYRGFVAVLCLRAGDVVVVEQFRKELNGYSYELPGGKIESSENLESAARRELMEETGLDCRTLYYLGKADVCPYLTGEPCYLFFAPETTEKRQQVTDDDEEINVEFHSLEDVFHKFVIGEWNNSELAHAILLAKLRGHLVF